MRDWPGDAAVRDVRDGRAPRRSSTARDARRAVGRDASRRSTPRTPSSPTSTRRSACRASASSAGCPTTSWSRRTRRCSRCRSTCARSSPNLDGFTDEGAEGRYGYYESLDYTPGRVPAGQDARRGQGVLRAPPGHGVRRARQRAHGRRDARALPRRPASSARPTCCSRSACRGTSSSSQPHVEEVEYVRSVRELPPPGHAQLPDRRHARAGDALPVQRPLLGHGHQRRRRLLAAGDDLAVTRYREDITRDCWGQFFYVRDVESGAVFSAPHNPYPARARRATTSSSRPTRPSSAGATATSRRTSRSSSRPRTMSRSAG